MKDCLFCKIVKGEIPADIVYQDKEIVSFRDINPMAPTHILIVPKKHIEGIQTARKKDQAILGRILLVAQKIAEKEKLKGYRVFANCGKLGGQAVFHLHFHLVGGWKTMREFRHLIKKRLAAEQKDSH